MNYFVLVNSYCNNMLRIRIHWKNILKAMALTRYTIDINLLVLAVQCD